LKNSKSHRKFLGQKWITYEVEQQKSKDIRGMEFVFPEYNTGDFNKGTNWKN
jgi:hypothetical protein